jgi:hypothetical protein
VLDDEGLSDPDKVKGAACALVERNSHLADRRPSGDAGQGARCEAELINLPGAPAGGGLVRCRLPVGEGFAEGWPCWLLFVP